MLRFDYINQNPQVIFSKKTYYPIPLLQDYISYYDVVEYKSIDNKPFNISDFPRTALDMVFCFDGNIRLKLKKDSVIDINSAYFIGNFDTPYTISFSSSLSIIHVRFKTQGIYPLTKIPLAKVLNQAVSVEDLINQSVADLYHRMGEKDSFIDRIKLLETFLIKKYSKSTINYRLNHGINLIQQKKGMVNIKELSHELNTNYKSLERWFKAKVGLSPKKFSSITRFKNILEDLESCVQPSWMTLVNQYGFYDQSHFIKKFEEYAGLSPEDYWEKSQVSNFYND